MGGLPASCCCYGGGTACWLGGQLLSGCQRSSSPLPPDAPCPLQRRVKAPGAFGEEGAEQLEEGQRREAQAHLRALMAAWQRVLSEFFPQMAEDVVTGALSCLY